MNFFNWDEILHQASVLYITLLIFTSYALVPFYIVFLLLYPWLWIPVIPYICWIYYDTKIAFNGGRRCSWFPNLAVFRYVREYFPARLIKTVDLQADRNYFFVMYPHALIPASTITNFLVNVKEFNELFPGIDFRYVTLNFNLYLPIAREHLIALGGCSCSEKSLTNLLTSKPSKAVLLLPGGALEASILRPGNTCEIIKRRKGFVRLALRTGTSLVPVFSFGENNICRHVDLTVSWLKPILDAFHKFTGLIFIVPKIYDNRSKTIEFLLQKVPLNTVVGEPIHVPKVENPSQALIDEYHEQFFEALVNLFEKHKEKYDIAGKNAQLVFL